MYLSYLCVPIYMITMSGCLCLNYDETITVLFPLCCSFHCIVYTIHMYLHVCVPIYMITMSGCSCLNYDETITLQSLRNVSVQSDMTSKIWADFDKD